MIIQLLGVATILSICNFNVLNDPLLAFLPVDKLSPPFLSRWVSPSEQLLNYRQNEREIKKGGGGEKSNWRELSNG